MKKHHSFYPLGLPLGWQLFGIIVGALIVAQLVTLLLTVLIPPAPLLRWDIQAVAESLLGEEEDSRLERKVLSGPPDISRAGWLISESSRQALADRVDRPVDDVVLAFYTQLPVGGVSVPVDRPPRSLAVSARDASGVSVVSMLIPEALAQAAPGVPQPGRIPGGGFPGGGVPGGGLPGGRVPGGGFPGGGLPGGRVPGGGIPGGGAPAGGVHGGGLPGGAAPDGAVQSTQQRTAPGVGSAATLQSARQQARPADTTSLPASSAQRNPATSEVPAVSDAAASPVETRPADLAPRPNARPGNERPAPTRPRVAPASLPIPSLQSSFTQVRNPQRTALASSSPAEATDFGTAPLARAAHPPAGIVNGAAVSAGTQSALPAEISAAPAPTSAGRPLHAVSGRPVPIPFRQEEGLLSFTSPPFIEGDFIAAMKRADGRWIAVAPRAEPFPNQWQKRVMLWFVLSLLIVGPLVWAFARRIVGPLQKFAGTAEALGRDPGASVLPLRGPAEIGRAAHAFNQMHNRLRAFVDDRTAMVGAISHDLRTPLTRLRFRLEDVSAEQREALLGEVDEMEAMITQVIGYFRDASSTSAREPVDLGELVASTVSDALVAGGAIDIESIEHVAVDADTVGLRRVLANMLENAVKYGGHARVRVSLAGEDAVAEVIDDGPGIPENEIEQVFDPFYRCEGARESGKPGSGLGLAVCRSIARAHGGDVVLLRRSEGFVAKLTLPVSYGEQLVEAA